MNNNRTKRTISEILYYFNQTLYDMIAIVVLLDLIIVRKNLKIFVEKHGKMNNTFKFIVIEQTKTKVKFVFGKKTREKIFERMPGTKIFHFICINMKYSIENKEDLEAVEQ